MALDEVFHNTGGHGQYSTNVEQTLVTYNEAFPDVSPAGAAALIRNLLNELRTDIISLQLTGEALK